MPQLVPLMPKDGQIPRSLSDMELNLMDEAVKFGSEQGTASSVAGDTAADMEDNALNATHSDGGVPSSKVSKGKRFLRFFQWRKKPYGGTELPHGKEYPQNDLEDGRHQDEDTARLIRAPPPELCFSDEELEDGTPQRKMGFWARVWAGLKLVGLFILKHWLKILLLAVIITLIVLTAVKGFSVFGDLLRWFQARNNWAGWGMFLGMYTVLVALFLPGVVFIMGAGFVFGFWKGLLAVWVGGAIGQAFAFLLARYLLRDWVEATLRGKWRKWEVLDRAIEHDGWKLVLIMRLSPIIPYNLLNVAMATTSMPFWQFTVVSAVGIGFECSIFCYIGSVASSITSIVSGDAKGNVVEWVFLGVSLVMCVLGAVFVSYSIKSAIKRADERDAASMHGLRGQRAQQLEIDNPPAPRWRDPELGANGGGVAQKSKEDDEVELRPVVGGIRTECSVEDVDKDASSSSLRVAVPDTDLEDQVDENPNIADTVPPSSSGHFISSTDRLLPSSTDLDKEPETQAEPVHSQRNSSGWSPQKPVQRQSVSGPLIRNLGKAKRSPLPLLGGSGTNGGPFVHSSGSDSSLTGSSPRHAEMTAFNSADVELGSTIPKLRRTSGSDVK